MEERTVFSIHGAQSHGELQEKNELASYILTSHYANTFLTTMLNMSKHKPFKRKQKA